MLTNTQLNDFCLAIDAYDRHIKNATGDENCLRVDPEDVVQTAESIENFIKTRGEPHEVWSTDHGTVHVWKNVQAAKGLRRGDVHIVDFGNARGYYFDGETSY